MDTHQLNSKKNLQTVYGTRLFFAYLVYMVWVVTVEWINFIPKLLFRVNLQFGIAEGSAVFVILGVCFFIRKNLSFEKRSIEEILGVLLILIVAFFFSVYPDSSYDTYNYHLIAQNPQFENYFVEDFGYGNFQVWGFRLCDRMFYYFRMLLGFRLGTMLNALALAVSFEQVYQLLNFIEKKTVRQTEKKTITDVLCNKLLWALAIIFSLDAVMMLGTYYVDVIMMPIGIYVLRQVVERTDDVVSRKDIYIFALLCSLWIGGKLTNVVYVFPCVLVFVILHVRCFYVKDWIISVILGVCCYAEYLVWNGICTGNPFFPYYNTIFKSRFFPVSNFKDTRWGGQSVFEKIFWVIYAMLKPEYRQSEIYDTHTLVLALGLIATTSLLILIIIQIIKGQKVNGFYASLIGIAIMSTLLWSFTTGYSRYFVIGRVFFGVIAFVVANRIGYTQFSGKLCVQVKVIPKLLSGTLTTAVFFNMIFIFIYSWTQGGWGWCQRNGETFVEQVCNVISDRDFDVTDDIDLFLLTSSDSQGVAELIEPDAYSFSLSYISKVEEDGSKLLNEALDKYTIGHDIHKRNFNDIEQYIETLNGYQLYLNDIEEITLPVGEKKFELLSLKNADCIENTLWISNYGPMKICTNDFTGKCDICFLAGFAYDWDLPAVEIVFLSDGEVLSNVEIDTKTVRKYETELMLPDNISELTMEARYMDSGEPLELEKQDFCFVANVQLLGS